MLGFPKKNFQVNLARHKVVKKNATTLPPHRIFLLLLVLGAVLAFIFLFASSAMPMRDVASWLDANPKATPQINTPEDFSTATNTLDRVVLEVSKQYLLPVGGTPTMALITSLDELVGQAFFAKAQVDDIVLMYMESKKGILWRPSTRQIIEIGPIAVSPPSTQ